MFSIFGYLKAALLGLMILGTVAATGAEKTTDGSKTTQQQTTTQSQGEKVNINTSDLETLTTLPRIGPAIAKRIIEFREEHGGFKELKEIMNVKGIGEKTYAKLEPLITL